MEATLTCAAESRRRQETLAGTFKPADVFFLIESSAAEYGGWQSEILKKAARSGGFAPYLQHLLAAPRTKALFIRRPQAEAKNFYIAMTHQPQPKIYHRVLSDFDDLMGLDTSGGVPRIRGRAMDEVDELYAVCANGRHDPCCAAYGAPVYQAMAAQVGADKVWQTTHIGGHRLAATMIAFPHGIAYGHLDPTHAEAVVASYRSGDLLLDKYRGRGAYAHHSLDTDAHCAAGAAESHVRAKAKNYALDGLDLVAVTPASDQQWQVTFADRGGKTHQAQVTMAMSAPRQASCQAAPKPMPLYQVTAYAVSDSV